MEQLRLCRQLTKEKESQTGKTVYGLSEAGRDWMGDFKQWMLQSFDYYETTLPLGAHEK